MDGRILDVGQAGRYLRLHRGFCLVEEHKQEVGRIALDDLECVIYHSYDGMISQNLMSELAERGIPLVVCNQKQMPVGIFWSLAKHHHSSERLAAQVALSLPKRKTIWQQIVKQKIHNQRQILLALQRPCEDLKVLEARVRSGDPDNCEAIAASKYWGRVFSDDFRRDQEGDGINALLNYGYAVLRASVTRSIVGAGMHPGLALHHHNASDPTPLANDLMEPWRPLVDWSVSQLVAQGETELTPKGKASLAEVLLWDMDSRLGCSPLRLCIQRMSQSLADICAGKTERLEIAELPSELHWEQKCEL
jgi:CRISPR-associated protein Cas1